MSNTAKTKVIDIPEDEPETDLDNPIFDRGESTRKEPMTLAQLEAAVIPKFLASQRKTKLKPVVVYTCERRSKSALFWRHVNVHLRGLTPVADCPGSP